MKANLIILGLILIFTGETFAYEKVYLERNPYYYGAYRPGVVYNSSYNPYSIYNNSAIQNTRAYYENLRRIRRINRLKKMHKRKYNYVSWFNNKNNQGVLTGYSLPVKQDDIYAQMGISPYNKKKYRTNSPSCNTDLFSSPMGDEMYYTNGELKKDLRGVSGKTGVTIIYD